MSTTNLIEIALLTKSIYDLQDMRKGLANRIRQYNLNIDVDWMQRLKTVERMEREYEKELQKKIEPTKYAIMLEVHGVGSKTVGGLIMHCIQTERVTDKKGKYKNTLFHNKLKTFNGLRSFWHYAGQHLRCKTCGYAKNKCTCKTSEFVIAKRRRGLPVDWNEKFRQWLLNVSSQLIKHRNSPYRKLYEEFREISEQKHEDWSKGHHFNHAKRLMTKNGLLQDFWNSFLRNTETQCFVDSQIKNGFSPHQDNDSHTKTGREFTESLKPETHKCKDSQI